MRLEDIFSRIANMTLTTDARLDILITDLKDFYHGIEYDHLEIFYDEHRDYINVRSSIRELIKLFEVMRGCK